MVATVPDGVGALRAPDRRRDARFEGLVKASFTISDAGGIRVVPCSIVSLSASGMRIGTGETVGLGQAIWVDIDGFGPIRASIESVRHDGFICQNLLNAPARQRLGTWVAWLARRNGRPDTDKRRFMRSRPRDSRTTIAFEDGEMIAVELRDVSRSGAAVITGFAAVVGSPVMVGQVLGKVSRTYPDGFAVEFERVLEAAEADRLVGGFQIKVLPLTHTG